MEPGDYYLEPADSVVEHGLCKVEEDATTSVCVVNLTDEPKVLRGGDLIGQLSRDVCAPVETLDIDIVHMLEDSSGHKTKNDQMRTKEL